MARAVEAHLAGHGGDGKVRGNEQPQRRRQAAIYQMVDRGHAVTGFRGVPDSARADVEVRSKRGERDRLAIVLGKVDQDVVGQHACRIRARGHHARGACEQGNRLSRQSGSQGIAGCKLVRPAVLPKRQYLAHSRVEQRRLRLVGLGERQGVRPDKARRGKAGNGKTDESQIECIERGILVGEHGMGNLGVDDHDGAGMHAVGHVVDGIGPLAPRNVDKLGHMRMGMVAVEPVRIAVGVHDFGRTRRNPAFERPFYRTLSRIAVGKRQRDHAPSPSFRVLRASVCRLGIIGNAAPAAPERLGAGRHHAGICTTLAKRGPQ